MSIQRKVTPEGKVRYRTRIKANGREVASRMFDRKSDAVAWEQDQRRPLKAGEWLDPRQGQVPLSVVAEMRLESRADLATLAGELQGLPEVREVSLTAGDPDIVVRVRVADLMRLKTFVHGLRQNAAIAHTKTMIVLESWQRTSGRHGAPGAP